MLDDSLTCALPVTLDLVGWRRHANFVPEEFSSYYQKLWI
jgi:hypothetical protein